MKTHSGWVSWRKITITLIDQVLSVIALKDSRTGLKRHWLNWDC